MNPGEPETNYFPRLPPDLTKYICLYCSKDSIQFMMTNSEIRKIVEQVCCEIWKTESVSRVEITRYLNRQPKMFGITGKFGGVYNIKYYGDHVEYYDTPYFHVYEFDEEYYSLYCSRGQVSWEDDRGVSIESIQENILAKKDDEAETPSLDLISLHRIWSRRKSLVRFNPNYAKDACLKLFHEFCSRCRKSNKKINNLYLFADLSMYIWLLNLDIDTTFLTDLEEEYSDQDEPDPDVYDDKILKYIRKIREHVILYLSSEFV